MYTVEFTPSAEKQFSNFDKTLQRRIIASLERCMIRPYPHVKKLVGNQYFSLRIGDYRVILDIRDEKVLILLIEIGHRKNIYA